IFVMGAAFAASAGEEGLQGVVWFYAAVAGGLLLAFNQSLSSGQQLAGVVVAAGAGILGSLLLAGSIRGVLQRRSTYVRPSSPTRHVGKPGAAPATPASLLGDSSRAAAARAAAAPTPAVAPVPSTLHRLTAPAAN